MCREKNVQRRENRSPNHSVNNSVLEWRFGTIRQKRTKRDSNLFPLILFRCVILFHFLFLWGLLWLRDMLFACFVRICELCLWRRIETYQLIKLVKSSLKINPILCWERNFHVFWFETYKASQSTAILCDLVSISIGGIAYLCWQLYIGPSQK